MWRYSNLRIWIIDLTAIYWADNMSILSEPAIARKHLILGAGLFWLAGGLILIFKALVIADHLSTGLVLLAIAGIIVGYIKHRLIFKRVVSANIRRIRELSPHKDKICLFAFQSIESYLLVILMVSLGFFLRSTPISSQYLIAIYLAVGTALSLASRYYFGQVRSI